MNIFSRLLLVCVLAFSAVKAESVETLMNSGQSLLSNGAYSQAASVFKKVLAREPNFFEARHNLGFAYLAMGKHAEAVRELERAVKLNGMSSETWSNLAVAYENTGNYTKSQNALYQAVKRDPNNVQARMNLATQYLNSGNTSAALEQFLEVIQIDENYPSVYTQIAKVYVAQNKYEKARHYLQQAIRVSSDDTEALWEMGKIYWKIDNDYKQAGSSFQTAISIQPTIADYYQSFAQMLQEQGHKQEAIKMWEKVSIHSTDPSQKAAANAQAVSLQYGDQSDNNQGAAFADTFSEQSVQQLQSSIRPDSQRKKTVQTMNTDDFDIGDDFSNLDNTTEPAKISLDSLLKK